MAVQSLPTAAAVAAAAATAKIQALDAVASNLGLSTSEILGNKVCINNGAQWVFHSQRELEK